MSRLILRIPWRFWATAIAAALGIIILLTGLRWQSSRHKIAYYNPPEVVHTGSGQQSDRVDDVDPKPDSPTGRPTASVPPNQPMAPVSQGKTNEHGLLVEEAGNATLGVSQRTPRRPRPPPHHLNTPY